MSLKLAIQKRRLDATRSAAPHDADFDASGAQRVQYHGNMARPSFRSPAALRREAKRETLARLAPGPPADRLGLIVAAIEKYFLAALNAEIS
jgi:hypothetical protein